LGRIRTPPPASPSSGSESDNGTESGNVVRGFNADAPVAGNNHAGVIINVGGGSRGGGGGTEPRPKGMS
jgi:hypothetical protein